MITCPVFPNLAWVIHLELLMNYEDLVDVNVILLKSLKRLEIFERVTKYLLFRLALWPISLLVLQMILQLCLVGTLYIKNVLVL